MKYFVFALCTNFALLLSACNFTTTNSLVSSHGEDIESYMENVLYDFYEDDTETLMAEFDPSVLVKSEQLDYLYKLRSGSGDLNEMKVTSRTKRTHNGKAYYVSLYEVPSEIGTEQITITVTADNDKCCVLYGLHFNLAM